MFADLSLFAAASCTEPNSFVSLQMKPSLSVIGMVFSPLALFPTISPGVLQLNAFERQSGVSQV